MGKKADKLAVRLALWQGLVRSIGEMVGVAVGEFFVFDFDFDFNDETLESDALILRSRFKLAIDKMSTVSAEVVAEHIALSKQVQAMRSELAAGETYRNQDRPAAGGTSTTPLPYSDMNRDVAYVKGIAGQSAADGSRTVIARVQEQTLEDDDGTPEENLAALHEEADRALGQAGELDMLRDENGGLRDALQEKSEALTGAMLALNRITAAAGIDRWTPDGQQVVDKINVLQQKAKPPIRMPGSLATKVRESLVSLRMARELVTGYKDNDRIGTVIDTAVQLLTSGLEAMSQPAISKHTSTIPVNDDVAVDPARKAINDAMRRLSNARGYAPRSARDAVIEIEAAMAALLTLVTK